MVAADRRAGSLMRMRVLPLLALAFMALVMQGAAAEPARDGTIAPPLSPRNANYTIDVRLDPANRALNGSQRIVWRNLSTRSTDELHFHLYWNAWKDANSTFMRERALGQWYSLWQGTHSKTSKILVKFDGNEVERWTAEKGYQPASKDDKAASEG